MTALMHPKLRVYLNLDSAVDLRADTVWAGLDESDRYFQAVLYKDLAHACFADAKHFV